MATEKRQGFERVGILYALALSGIAAAIIISQVLVQRYISKQEYDSRVINLAGRQRMLSQQISKLALQIDIAQNPEERQPYTRQLQESLSLWTKSHEGLLEGDKGLGVSSEKSNLVDSMYQSIAPYYQAMVAHTESILQLLEKKPAAAASVLQPHIREILAHEASFLKGMDRIVFQYDHEARSRVLYLESIELLLLGISLAIIFFELLFIFRPTARHIRQTIKELVQSEKLATEMTHELGMLYSSLEKSYQELAEVDVIEDQPAVYASTDSAGDFTYVSDKLCEVLSYDIRKTSRNMFGWLEQQGYGEEQVRHIHRLVVEGKPWNGEVKATSEEGDFIWLDMSLVPALDEAQQVSSLHMVCADKTERKEAEARSQEITREKIEKEVKEQRFRSILILEGQEEERRRISRDIHDGIGQLLTALKFKIEAINLAPDMPGREGDVAEAKAMLDQVIREVRRVAFNLNPSALNDYGLVAVTKRFCTEASRLSDKKVIFENKTGFINRMDKSVETNLYRIIQEAVNNAIKYAQADEIRVVFSHKAHYLNVEITDNGIGFDFLKYMKRDNINGSGLGIFNMQERTSFVNGTFEMKSEEGKGTQINLHLPINGRKNGHH